MAQTIHDKFNQIVTMLEDIASNQAEFARRLNSLV